jgi:hypothetical protein
MSPFREARGNDKQQFREAVAEVSKDTPQAKVAVQRINFFSTKVSPETWGMLRDIISNLAAEALKAMLRM